MEFVFVSTSSNYRTIARLAIPTSLEMLLQSSFGFIDQIIIGKLGEAAIAAVGLTSSTALLFIMTFGSIGASTAILAAKALGANDRERLSHLSTVGFLLTIVLTVLLSGPLCVLAKPALQLLGAEQKVVAIGWPFFACVIGSMALAVANSVLSQLLRLLGKPKLPLYTSIVGVVINSVIAYSTVYGVWGMPKLGLLGAGLGFVVSNAMRCITMFKVYFGANNLADWQLPSRVVLSSLLKDIMRIALPMQGSKFSWSFGVFLYAVIGAHLGVAAMAANQILASLESMFLMGSQGVVTASSTLVNQALGRGEAEQAKQWVIKCVKAGLLTGFVFTLGFVLATRNLESLYPKVDHHVLQVAALGGWWLAAIQVGKVFNMMNGSSLLASGGDPKGVFYGDALGIYVVGLPLAYFGGLHWDWGVMAIFIAKAMEDIFKMGFFGYRLYHIDWNRAIQNKH